MPAEKLKSYMGSQEWADDQLRYLLGLLKDQSSWNSPHNWYCKRVIAFMLLDRFQDRGFPWHYKVGSGHFHRWLKNKSWEKRR